MNFDYGFKELSGSNMAFDVSNVHINDGAAQFDGNAKLTLWGFMNKELGKKFAIRLRFKPDPTSTVRGSIISNCGMTGSPTVSIALENHQLKFSAKSMSFRRPTVIKDHFDVSFVAYYVHIYFQNAFKNLILQSFVQIIIDNIKQIDIPELFCCIEFTPSF